MYREFYFFDRLVKNKTIGQIYNVTHPERVTWEKLLNTVMDVSGIKGVLKRVDTNQYQNAREYFPFRDCTYLLDITKQVKHNLYVPQIDLVEGLALSYKWYLKNNPKRVDHKMNKIEKVLYE